jgi:hypothetical protein
MRTMAFGLKVILSAASLIAGSMLCAQGKAVTSHDGSCQVTVGADWSVTTGFGIANSADKSVNVAVTMPRGTTTLADLKQTVQMIYTGDKIVKDTASEFQMEGMSVMNAPNVYRAIQLPGKICVVEVTYTSGTIDDARNIAMTLKANK